MLNNQEKRGSFDQIDDYFASRSPSEVSLILMGCALVIGYLVYTLVFSYTEQELINTENKIKSIKQKINTENNYLLANSQAKLTSIRKDVERKNIEFENISYKMSYVDNKLHELSYLLFDDRSWAGFVDNISALAKHYKVDIKSIGNRFFEPTFQKITHVVEVNIHSEAEFKNTVKFLNAIEESQLVIDVNDINMTSLGDQISSRFKIAVWGMKYQ
jgi:hypothetical protein